MSSRSFDPKPDEYDSARSSNLHRAAGFSPRGYPDFDAVTAVALPRGLKPAAQKHDSSAVKLGGLVWVAGGIAGFFIYGQTMIDLPTPALLGVVHLPALPGSPANLLPIAEIISRAVADATALVDAGFDALVVENFGDRPFFASSVEPATIASMAVVAKAVGQSTGLPVGINVLRNDAMAALGIAAAAGAAFIRVNVFTGVAATDQGVIEGSAARVLRYRKQLGLPIAVFADVHVKHAVPQNQPNIAEAAKDAAYRGLADGLIVTGSATGEPVCLDDLRAVRRAVPDRRVLVGSGVTQESVSEILSLADGVIVGTSLKEEGVTDRPIDPSRAQAFVEAARRR